MCQSVFAVVSSVVLAKENLDVAPCELSGVCVVPGVRFDKVDAVVDGAVHETLRVEIAVRTPAVADDCSARFDPGMYNGHQCICGSVRNGYKKCSAGPSFNIPKHPLTFNRVSPMILTPTELAFINFDGLIRITDLIRAALHKHQHSFPAEHAPVSNGMFNEAVFFLDLVGRFVVHNLVRGVKNFKEGKITLMEPRAVLDKPGLATLNITNHPLTSPTKSLIRTGICVPLHILTTFVALHLTPKQAHVLKKLDGHGLFNK
jgi:hypothetical protein